MRGLSLRLLLLCTQVAAAREVNVADHGIAPEDAVTGRKRPDYLWRPSHKPPLSRDSRDKLQ